MCRIFTKGNFSIFTIALPIFLFLIYLGTWQLSRLNEKDALISSIRNSINSQPIEFSGDVSSLDSYLKLKLQGHFLQDNIFVYGRRSANSEKDGYYILTPFVLNHSSEKILVARAWVPYFLKTKIESGEVAIPSGDNTEIIAMNMPGEKKLFFVPDNDISKNIWFFIDLKLANTLLATNEKFYFKQIRAEGLPSDFVPLQITNADKIPNNHLEYAITWYLIAAASLVIFFLKNYRQKTKK